MTVKRPNPPLTPVQLKAREKRLKHKKINRVLTFCMLALALLVIGLFAYNIIVIGAKGSTASGDTLSVDKGNSLSNDYYTIGNNPTAYEKEVFNGLTDAVKAQDPYTTVEYVVKSFIADFFTWTNKDGNYEVGGLQYIFGAKSSAFEVQSRYQFYADLDLYIAQYGRENLLQVQSIETTEVVPTDEYTINDAALTLPCYYVEATWTYEPSKLDTTEFQTQGYFYVVDNDGRYEIVEFYS